MIFPIDTNENIYNVMHMKIVLPTGNLGVHADGLYYTSVDMELNNGHEGVLEKRVPILLDTLVHSNLTATKHADGMSGSLYLMERSKNTAYRLT